MWIRIRKTRLPPSTIALYNSLKFKCNDDIHLCLLVLISPWWIGGARSEATHSPQLLMHKEKAGEGLEMYFLLGFQGIPPFDIVTIRVGVKDPYPLDTTHHGLINYKDTKP
jgi:hypothetical protein